ncbi:ThiF family adenylyltransferase [Sphingobacterium endophyticum]|uniref:ThiF family adenylyltransferase n=1 Tax=Sphingobacterium endophyticum TaxID=2546448 RepID=UPI0012E1585E|nr:ThiF family adenylyltransferase [Sphingobacterium endophyticum]
MKKTNTSVNLSYQPIFFDKSNPNDILKISELKENGSILFEFDEIERQLKDLFICRFPNFNANEEHFSNFIGSIANGKHFDEIGVWVFYPWKYSLVHLLDKQDFLEVRTNRNKQKITEEEQQILESKTLGIIGLSVGQSVALTIALERGCGRMKLADYDTLDLSNLNRLRTGVFNIGVSKVILAAREIAEIDPYMEVEVFPEGITDDNMNNFLQGDHKLNLLIEVCDNFEVKVESRIKARELNIPVIMETNDRGMLDVERFDLNPTMPIFHGLAGDLNIKDVKSLDSISRMGLLMKIVNAKDLSERMKNSLPEIGKSLKSWPQLASEVVLGGGITAWASRKLLLGYPLNSGRVYVDIEKIMNINVND